MLRLLPFLFLSILLSSCESGKVESTFTEIVDLHTSDDRSGIEDYFDKDTHSYIDQLAECAKSGDVDKAYFIGKERDATISTLIIYYSLAGTEEKPDTTVSDLSATKEFIWLYFMLDGTGVFRHAKDHPIRIYDGATVRGDVADLNVGIPTGNNAVLGTNYVFNKEDEAWKLNFPSTMRVMEKIYVQNQRNSGLSFRDYAKQVSQQSGGELQFKYRRYQ